MWERITRIFGQQDLKRLNDRILRLEAKEAVLSSFHRYLYSMDTGFKDDILDCYTSDAVLDVPNFPDAGGADLHFEGRDQIAPLYEPYGNREPGIGGGHHSANIAININLQSKKAEVTSYFMTGTKNGVQGGRYEGVMRKDNDDVWRWETLSITSTWGWRVADFETISDAVSLKYSPFNGRHAAYREP